MLWKTLFALSLFDSHSPSDRLRAPKICALTWARPSSRRSNWSNPQKIHHYVHENITVTIGNKCKKSQTGDASHSWQPNRKQSSVEIHCQIRRTVARLPLSLSLSIGAWVTSSPQHTWLYLPVTSWGYKRGGDPHPLTRVSRFRRERVFPKTLVCVGVFSPRWFKRSLWHFRLALMTLPVKSTSTFLLARRPWIRCLERYTGRFAKMRGTLPSGSSHWHLRLEI